MKWNRLHCLKSYVRGSLWVAPFGAMLLYAVVTRITHYIG